VAGLNDPARPEAADAINKCREAGIRVMMITGDSKDTAVAIAKEVNILTAADDLSVAAFTGEYICSYPYVVLLMGLRQANIVFGRPPPRHPRMRLSLLASLGETTAMTGDGTDAFTNAFPCCPTLICLCPCARSERCTSLARSRYWHCNG
jgi:magnesium-transporting ATPase (P-type)